MAVFPQRLQDREQQAKERVTSLRKALEESRELPQIDDLCIYVTGSYGRLEAHPYSDLDVFFIRKGNKKDNQISRVDKSLLDAAVIRISRDLGFPEFTRGGVYLDVHYVEDILRTLGSPEDDYKNYFTARMLLLLESLPLFNTEVYNEVISDTIQTYYRDYHDHETDFHPVFLVNDIHRYWKTMCLNYEHIRNRKESMTEEQKNKAHLKNLKLKFSRLLTCYSMIVPILSTEGAVSSEVISRLVHQIPMERLTDLAKERSHLAPVIKTISEKYCWFLEQTGASEPDVLRWIGNRANRNTAFEEARSFGRQMHELASHAPIDPEKLKYLTV